ncbi:MAG TPA: PQQ-binding-like beta-propeller repeat protein [Planctomycetota bacterium]|nr:PQQ-binding-like beta-propeller repeat protein [Planctomycetota bacterium]
MRRHFLVVGRVALVASALALAPLAVTRSQDDTSESGANRIHLPINEEVSSRLDAAEAAIKAGDTERAIDLLGRAVEVDYDPKRPNLLVPAGETPAATSDQPNLRQFVGVTEKSNAILRSLPKEARETFRKKFDRRADAAFKAALESDDPVRETIRALDRYPLATKAAETLESVADRAFAKGELDRARRLYARLLREYKADVKVPVVREKLVLACIPLGRKKDVEGLLKEMASEDKDARIHVNGVAKTADEVLQMTLKQEALVRGEGVDSKPSLVLPRGDTGNRASFGRAIRLGAAKFQPRSFDDNSFDGRVRFDRGSDPGPARYVPLVWGDSIFLATADRLRAFGLDGTERPKISLVGRDYSDDNPNVQFGAAIEHGILIAPFVAVVQDDQSFRGIPIRVKIPLRKLGGFDIERWRWKWTHRDLLVNTELDHASFPVGPICSDGDCFVAAFKIEGFVHCYAVCFDADTGAKRWATWIASGQVEQTMFGEHAREPLCAPVAVGEGRVFDATQMGCVAALDQDTGRLRWVSEYDQIIVNSAKGYYPDPRNIIWENNAPVVDEGVVVVTPMDSEYAYGFKATTGEQVWRLSNKRNGADGFRPNYELHYLVGAADGRVVFAGGQRIVCLDIKTGARKWTVELERRVVAGRGVIGAGKVYVPTTETIEVVNLATGTVEGSQAVRLGGNLAVAGDTVVIVSDGQVGAFENRRTEKAKDF